MILFRGFFLFLISLKTYSFSNFSMDLGLDSRIFTAVENSTIKKSNNTLNTNISLKIQNESIKSTIDFYAQFDPADENRNYIIPKDVWLAMDSGNQIFKIGFQVINWSTLEAFHPSDILNSRSFDSNLQNSSKIGEPMLSYKFLFGESSSVKFMYMPYYTDPIFASEKSGFSPSFKIGNIEIYKKDGSFEENNFIDQGALQFSTTFLSTDLSLSYINHIDRDTPFISPTQLFPEIIADAYFFRKEQFGITSQSVFSNWLVKTEIAFINWENEITSVPSFKRDDHSVVALGFERSTSLATGSDLTFIFEHQYYYGIDESLLTNIFFQNDILVGLRFSLNDTSSKVFFISLISDLDSGTQYFLNINYNQRIFESWKIDTGIHFIDSNQYNNYVGLDFFDKSDHFYFNLKKYF